MHSRLEWAVGRLRHGKRVTSEGLLLMEGGARRRVPWTQYVLCTKENAHKMDAQLFFFFNVVYFCYVCVHAHVCAHAISHILGTGDSSPLSLLVLGIEPSCCADAEFCLETGLISRKVWLWLS